MPIPMFIRAKRLEGAPQRMEGQKGAALFVTLIVLVAMLLSGIALIRSVDTTNVIAGNLSFKQAALHAADLGVEAAVAELPNIVATSLEANITPPASSTLPNYWYYATLRETDVKGLPTTKAFGAGGTAIPINWSNVPVASTSNGYSVKYVIDRLCQGPTPVTDLQANCFADAATGGGTKKAGGTVFSGTTTVYYRISVQVTGPRNTVSYVQATIKR